MMGTAMIALYPRFFSEQFYNIKDMVFVATFMIAMFVSVELIESKFKWNWIFCFSAATAVSANVRIVGIIFLMLNARISICRLSCWKNMAYKV